MTPHKTRSLFTAIVVIALFALMLTACADAASEGTTTSEGSATTAPTTAPLETTTTTAATTTTVAATTTTTDAAVELPDTPVTASLGVGANNTYKVEMGTFAALPFTDADLPAAPGSVEIRWYTQGDRYVVAYVGIDLSTSGPLCPGNSILSTATGLFEDVSNAPTEDGACEGFPTVTPDPNVGPRDCGGSVVYVTAIPSDKEGTLFGTLEALADDGGAIVGLTSQATTSADIAEIDVDAVCGA